MTYHHFYQILLSRIPILWQETSQGCEYQEVEIIGYHLEGWLPEQWTAQLPDLIGTVTGRLQGTTSTFLVTPLGAVSSLPHGITVSFCTAIPSSSSFSHWLPLLIPSVGLHMILQELWSNLTHAHITLFFPPNCLVSWLPNSKFPQQ